MAAQPQHRWQRGMHQPGTSTGGITPASPWEHPPTGLLPGPGATPARLEQSAVVPEAHGNWCFQHNTTPGPELADMRSQSHCGWVLGDHAESAFGLISS
jgi:hypothetical protein